MNIINLKNIAFRYDVSQKPKSFSISDLNLEIDSSDFISIMGPNGSGKSTLLKLIANLIEPDSGEITLEENKYSSIERKIFAQRISFVPQISNIIFPYSVYEIVMMGRTPRLNFYGFENAKDHKRVAEVLKLLEIDHLKNKGINEVSGGEAQRALIARALVQDPRIMLLDEPNTHLDIKHQLNIFNLLKKLNTEFGLTVILISHDINLSAYFSNRIILMKNGSIHFDSKPEDVLTEKNIKLIFNVESKIYNGNSKENIFVKINPSV